MRHFCSRIHTQPSDHIKQDSVSSRYQIFVFVDLEEAFEEGGPSEMRNEIEYIIGLLKFFYKKTKSNDYYDEYDLFYYYSKKYYKPRKRRNFFNDERQLNLELN